MFHVMIYVLNSQGILKYSIDYKALFVLHISFFSPVRMNVRNEQLEKLMKGFKYKLSQLKYLPRHQRSRLLDQRRKLSQCGNRNLELQISFADSVIIRTHNQPNKDPRQTIACKSNGNTTNKQK